MMTIRSILAIVLLLGACASDNQGAGGGGQTTPPTPTTDAAAAGGTPDRTPPMTSTFASALAAFRAYAASKLGVPESKLNAGPITEAIANTRGERVGSAWAFLADGGNPDVEVRAWVTADGTIITLDQNLGVLFAEAGVWGGGVSPPLTAPQLAERLTWSLGMNTTLFSNKGLGIPAPALTVTGGAGTLIFVVDAQPPGRAGAGRPPRNLVRYEITLTADQKATATSAPLKNP